MDETAMNKEYGEDRKWLPFEDFIGDMTSKGTAAIYMYTKTLLYVYYNLRVPLIQIHEYIQWWEFNSFSKA